MKLSEFINQFRQGNVSARSHMKNLIEIAMVDGNFDDVEYDLLKKIAKRHNISERELKEIKKNMAGISFEVPENKHEKFNQLYDLVHMMTIDDYVDHDEMNLCKMFAKKFGFEKNADELVESIKDNILNQQTVKDTYSRLDWMMA